MSRLLSRATVTAATLGLLGASLVAPMTGSALTTTQPAQDTAAASPDVSGNTTFPHLHFHVMDSPSPLASDGLPYEFDRFFSPGSIANVDELAAGEPAVFDPALSGRHSRQLPMELQAVGFRS